MEANRDQLAEALYQKGLALAEIESLKVHISRCHIKDFVYINSLRGYINIYLKIFCGLLTWHFELEIKSFQ